MEIREVTLREKRYYPNASYVMITNDKKQYFTKKALIELYTKLNDLLIQNVSVPFCKCNCQGSESDCSNER